MANATSEWTLITVTYNNSSELAEWWAGTDLGDVKWIVVDNNSSDGTADTAAALGADVVRLGRNVGFSRANNVGLERTTSEFVASSLPEIAKLVRERRAVVCPQLTNPDGSPQPNGRGLPFLIDKLAHRGVNLPGSRLSDYIPPTNSAPTFVAWAMGAAICAQTKPLQIAGGWDERYFLYYEDHAFGLDAWRRGQEVIVLPSARWTHAWKRETKGIRLKPWMREIASAARFYSQYPGLLVPRGGRRREWLGRPHKFGTALGTEPTAVDTHD